jgi:hypothetical protein
MIAKEEGTEERTLGSVCPNIKFFCTLYNINDVSSLQLLDYVKSDVAVSY